MYKQQSLCLKGFQHSINTVLPLDLNIRTVVSEKFAKNKPYGLYLANFLNRQQLTVAQCMENILTYEV